MHINQLRFSGKEAKYTPNDARIECEKMAVNLTLSRERERSPSGHIFTHPLVLILSTFQYMAYTLIFITGANNF